MINYYPFFTLELIFQIQVYDTFHITYVGKIVFTIFSRQLQGKYIFVSQIKTFYESLIYKLKNQPLLENTSYFSLVRFFKLQLVTIKFANLKRDSNNCALLK